MIFSEDRIQSFRIFDEGGMISIRIKLTWLALGEDQAALSRRVEQLIAHSEVCEALGGPSGVDPRHYF